MRIPVLHYESGWAGYALHHPGATLANWPGLFLVLLARCFVSPGLANWSGAEGRLQWAGTWDGLSSLYNHSTLGLAWLCLLLTGALWIAVPGRRRAVVWVLGVMVSALVAFSGVFASLANFTSLDHALHYTDEETAGRYLFPLLLGWWAAVTTLLFAERPSPATIPGPDRR